jgi:hypothetical protein
VFVIFLFIHFMVLIIILLYPLFAFILLIFRWLLRPYTNIIINLASHDLVMEIMQISFIHNSYILRTNIVHWKHIWYMYL